VVISVSAASWPGLSPSKTSCRTCSTWAGAARSMAARPAAVSTANAPRASDAQSCLATRPRRCIRASWCETRLCSQTSASAISNTRSRPSGASLSATSTS
jgi:hypothetical protein